MSDIKKPFSVWLLVERNLTGTENQLAAVAEALSRIFPDISVQWKKIERGSWFMPRLETGFFWENDSKKPDLVIAAGNLSVLPALMLKNRGVKVAYIQDPRWPWRSRFDRIYAPHHDAISGDNVMATDGSPTRVREFIDPAETGTSALIIGGGRKGKQGVLDLNALPTAQRWLVSFSRRTPDTIKQQVRTALPEATIYDPAQGGENPYLDFLRRADTIYVTDDSASMISDACSTGRRVSIVPFLRPTGRLQRLADHLRSIGAVDAQNPVSLKDADRVANDIAGTLLTR